MLSSVYVMLSYVMSCYLVICHVILCYITLFYVILILLSGLRKRTLVKLFMFDLHIKNIN